MIIIHYQLNNDMYFRNFKSRSEKVMKRMIAEGIATYTSRALIEETDEDIYWLGYLSTEEVWRWKEYAVELKDKFREPLINLIKNGEWNDNLQYEFFSIVNPEKLWKGRLAYLYGYEIVKNISNKYSIEKILRLTFPEYMSEINKYVNLDSII